jgi:hypothetical protein
MKQTLKRALLFVTLLLGTLFPLAAQSTQMTVILNSGEERSFLMMENDRVYFEDNVTLVVEQGVYTKSITTFPLADIRKILCREVEGTDEQTESALSIYPNPVHDVLTLRNLQGKQIVCIYALDGRLMKAFEATGDQTVDISDLSRGVYLVTTQSQTLKMIKL